MDRTNIQSTLIPQNLQFGIIDIFESVPEVPEPKRRCLHNFFGDSPMDSDQPMVFKLLNPKTKQFELVIPGPLNLSLRGVDGGQSRKKKKFMKEELLKQISYEIWLERISIILEQHAYTFESNSKNVAKFHNYCDIKKKSVNHICMSMALNGLQVTRSIPDFLEYYNYLVENIVNYCEKSEFHLPITSNLHQVEAAEKGYLAKTPLQDTIVGKAFGINSKFIPDCLISSFRYLGGNYYDITEIKQPKQTRSTKDELFQESFIVGFNQDVGFTGFCVHYEVLVGQAKLDQILPVKILADDKLVHTSKLDLKSLSKVQQDNLVKSYDSKFKGVFNFKKGSLPITLPILSRKDKILYILNQL